MLEIILDNVKEVTLDKSNIHGLKNPVKKAGLDFYLITKDLYCYLEKVSILPGYRTDHSKITLEIQIGKFKKGHSYWKFNNS